MCRFSLLVVCSLLRVVWCVVFVDVCCVFLVLVVYVRCVVRVDRCCCRRWSYWLRIVYCVRVCGLCFVVCWLE